MARFDVYINTVSQTPRYLCQLQSEYHDHLHTCVVAPLYKNEDLIDEYQQYLTPRIEIEDEVFLLLLQEIATITTNQLGKKVGSLTAYQSDITRAVDFLMQGF